MNVVLNGEVSKLDEGTTVADVVARLTGDSSNFGVAVAVNGEVMPRRQWPIAKLRDEDRVEVLSAMQGG